MTQLTFSYKALDKTGAATKGVLHAPSRDEAYQKIVAAGMRPIRIVAKRALLVRRNKGSRASIKELSHFTYQFSVLTEARIPIADGLRSIGEQESNRPFAAVIEDVASQIEAGCTVTEALHAHRELFGDVYVDTVRAAEKSGNMIAVLARLADMLDRQYETTKNVRGALMYPVCVVLALSAAVLFLMVFVVPRFAEMFATRGLSLPLPTIILMTLAEFIRTYWYLLLLGVGGGIWGIRKAWKDRTCRCRIDRWLHKIPGLGQILVSLGVSRFSHVFGVSLSSGLGLIEALDMAGRSSGRPLLQADAAKMRDQVKHGGRLSDVLLACAYLPAFARRMIAAGEEAAELPKMCQIVARHYDREVSHLTKNIGTVIEPILITGLAGVVLMIALAIFLPMWEMGALLG